MTETPVDIPTSRWEWLLADKRRLAAFVAAAVVILALIGAFVVRPLLTDSPRSVREIPVGPLLPIDETPSATEPTASPGADDADGVATDAPGVDDGAADGRPDRSDSPQEPYPQRAPYVAYRLAGNIWVVREDGTRPVRIIESPDGAYALSPDGALLAIVEGGELAIVDVASRSRTLVGEAEPHGLAWHADSSSVLFLRAVGTTGAAEDAAPAGAGTVGVAGTAGTAGAPELAQADETHGATYVYKVSRRGGEPVQLLRAGEPATAADGTVAAPALFADRPPPDPARGSLWVIPPGKAARQLETRGQAGACDVEAGRIVYAVTGMRYSEGDVDKEIRPEIWVMSTAGRGSKRLVGPPSTERPFGYGNLMLSPDGSKLLFAEVGDDGYSRARVIALDGSGAVSLTARRDTYPVGWSVDGRRVFFVEGNAFQGERTSLMSVLTDGSERRTVVSGGGL